ncbi:MAG TPA: prolyl oligopeptidase family serine peptidase [Kineosporiaceae bacterium]|nr:prolyl oligopeptidase family serine peptidase [Kineosporiaceae bacterium]
MRVFGPVVVLLSLLFATGCGRPAEQAPQPREQPSQTLAQPSQTLAQARKGFTTHLVKHVRAGSAVETPPPGSVRLVHYPSPVGSLPAYLAPAPDAGRHPAIIWITGGDYNSIGDVWSRPPAGNDQTAAQYREAGIVMLYPSLRGGNDNPGYQEGFLGETEDILAAADFLARQPGVDPQRIYLGGHSTGGTMALIESEYTGRFRAVFSFGPVGAPDQYDPPSLQQPGDPADPRELQLRSPVRWLGSITSPTFVFEGTGAPSNKLSLLELKSRNTSPLAHFHPVEGYTHFSVLGPVNRLIAQKIVADSGPACDITFTAQELAGLGKA